MSHQSDPQAGNPVSTTRLEAFSDGVFAIAITLLVLDLHVPEQSAAGGLFAALRQEWPQFLAFLIGFFTILICWINHHYMFSLIHRSDSGLIMANGFKLLVVSITPFATALLSRNMDTAWGAAAVQIYAFNFTLMGAAMSVIWFYAKRKGFVSASAKQVRAVSTLYVVPGVLASTIWLVSYVSIPVSLVLFGLMFALFVSPASAARWIRTRDERKRGGAGAEGLAREEGR